MDHSNLAYPVNEAARQIGVSRTTIYELIKSGEIASVVLGGKRLIERDELLRLLEKNRNHEPL